jgi:hypothetical protein
MRQPTRTQEHDRVDRVVSRYLENLDPISGNYFRTRWGLMPLGGCTRLRSGPSEDRQRRTAMRDDMLARLKDTLKYRAMTTSNFARIVSRKIELHGKNLDPRAAIPADAEGALLHFVHTALSGKLSEKSIANILAKKTSQSL